MFGIGTTELLIIFGIGVLGFAIAYEKGLKKVVDEVRSWPGV